MMNKKALVSVWDKEGIKELARELINSGYEIIATGQTCTFLKENGIKAMEVSEYTGFPEILSGRVKTLSPKIFGGILSLRQEKEEIPPIDIVVCNLYPFEKKLTANLSLSEMIEFIDIGGVALLRAGAKNYQFVTVVFDPQDYPLIIQELKENKTTSLSLREKLALKAFQYVAYYDAVISEYLRRQFQAPIFSEYLTLGFKKLLELRYGENPHQKGSLYLSPFSNFNFQQIQGKELSYNNLLDIDQTIALIKEFSKPVCAIIKHNTPCGVAIDENPLEAFKKAYLSDPKSAFGGIVGFNCPVEQDLAEEMINTVFLEVVLAPSFSSDALKVFGKKKTLRVIKFDGEIRKIDFCSSLNGMVLQDADTLKEEKESFRLLTAREPTEEEWQDAVFAWQVVKYVRSNGIVIAKNLMTVGIGAGQTSRVDSVEIAIKKSEGRQIGGVLASDGFFPFRDSVDIAASNGIKVIIEPGGSVRDEEVISAAKEHNISLIFTGIRHFRH